MTEERIRELRALAEKATPGPWQPYSDFPRDGIIGGGDVLFDVAASEDRDAANDHDQDDANVAFVIAAREALTVALDAIDRVRFECERALGYGSVVSSRDVAECVLAALEGTRATPDGPGA